MTKTKMASNPPNDTTDLVLALLSLAEEDRRSHAFQSICQLTYYEFTVDDPRGSNISHHVVPTKLSTLADWDIHSDEDDYIIAPRHIHLYIYPIFIFLGIIGNSLSCYIMSLNVRRYGYSANLYLSLLAFVDCLFLLGSALPNWISTIQGGFPIRSTSDFACRFFYWFGNFTTHLSAGLVVSVTVERFIAIQYPLLAHKINTVKHTHIVLIILITFFFLLDSRLLIFVKYIKATIHVVLTCRNDTHVEYIRPEIDRCRTTNENHKQIWAFIDFAVYTLIPFLIIVTFNCLIIRRLVNAQRIRQCMSQSKRKSFHCEQQHLNHDATDNLTLSSERKPHMTRSRSVPVSRPVSITFRSQRLRSGTDQSIVSTGSALEIRYHFNHQYGSSFIRRAAISNNVRLTIVLLFVSWSFLALTLPAVVLNLFLSVKYHARSSAFANDFHSVDIDVDSSARFYYAIARLLMIMNHSINFLLYFVVGKRFRRDLKRLCYSC